MSIDEAAKILLEMRENAPDGEIAIQAIMFAIKYHDQIEGLRLAELSSAVGNGAGHLPSRIAIRRPTVEVRDPPVRLGFVRKFGRVPHPCPGPRGTLLASHYGQRRRRVPSLRS